MIRRACLRFLSVVIATIAALAASRSADAHPVPFSFVDLRVQPMSIDGTLVVHMFDLAHDLNIDQAERLLDPTVAAQESPTIVALLSPRLTVRVNGQTLTPQWSSAEPLVDRQSLRLSIHYTLAGPPATMTVTTNMFPYDPVHQTFVNVAEGGALTQSILDQGRSTFTYYAGTPEGALAVMRTFLATGFEHIFLGPDHLIFLLGLLMLGGSLRQLTVIVTAFTLTHAVALTLASLNVVQPPARLIEPAIALSIIYVGADNLLIRGGRDVRVWIAAAFGVIHGFGYAGVLREMDLPRRALGWSVLSLNAGMEIAQLLVVAVIATALTALRSRNEAAGRQLAFVGSVVVMVAGTFWFIQRVFFPGGIS
ncbi:MAG TPA: HupE/UreJ family protein [Vicinamibacterales bacterium]